MVVLYLQFRRQELSFMQGQAEIQMKPWMRSWQVHLQLPEKRTVPITMRSMGKDTAAMDMVMEIAIIN